MKVRNLSFSSRVETGNSFAWVYQLEDLGYTGWEIVQEGLQTLHNGNLGEVREIRDTTDLKITMHLPFSDMNLAGLNDGIRNEALRQMHRCLALGSGIVELAVVHPGYLSPYGSQMPEKAWSTHIGSIRNVCDTAAEYGITIAVENMPEMPKIFGKYPDEMLRTLEEVNRDNVGMTLDIGHANTVGVVDEFLEKCKDQILHMHIHDNHGKSDEHLPLGRGTVQWKKIMESLKGYNGRLVTEMASLQEGEECLAYLRNL
ncbi:MAG: fructoselysine 3-epimerase [Methanomethylovorans sp. PtaU1.Bin093]|uniref:sugar phosphate isomerase/epimerase family protein n=1 Tax=Methanomethylovorans sp. PtaU1.Bin093 TaxID=1811679 RepID=UPI0009C71BC5|nr:sugar phosphate isomerase/epimerase [Methanomethylovorans sp. PtaU1.Bin093]OPY20993.1 MAG: fructoselysine 3-epimerase [Methanomethylovorans sp. PtaU1.Bin093]